MTYVNTRAYGAVETVDEFTTRREALKMLREYRLSAPSMDYYLSDRCTRDWRAINANPSGRSTS